MSDLLQLDPGVNVVTEFPETKSEILLRIQSAEDLEAWEEFVSMYRPVIYRMARRRGL